MQRDTTDDCPSGGWITEQDNGASGVQLAGPIRSAGTSTKLAVTT